MKPASQSRLARLVLFSAAALLVLGLLTLGLALRNAEAFAREEARSRATTTIEGLQANLRQPRLLEILDEDSRFVVQSGRLLVSDAVQALDARGRIEEIDFREETLRSRMDRLQKERGKESMLRKIEEELRANPGNSIDRLLLANEGAWRAEQRIREGDGERKRLVVQRDAFVQAYEATRRGSRSPGDLGRIPLAIDRSAFLLRASAGLSAPTWSSELLGGLRPKEAQALVERAADLAPDTFAAKRFGDSLDQAQRVWTRKKLLEEIRSGMGSFLDRREPWYRITGDRILLWYPNATPALGPGGAGEEAGRGALLEQELLLDRLRPIVSVPDQARKLGLLPMTWSGTLLQQGEAPSGALPVWAGLWLLPEDPTAAGLGGQPWFLGWLFVLVFILLIGGLWQILTSMKRERAAMALRSEFLTSVTHELKTPLSSIRLFTEMLAEGRVDNEDKRREYHRLLAGEATRLSALVENVLDLGRMERGERSYDPRREDLGDLVDEAVELFRPIAEAEGLAIRLDRDDGVALPVSVDRTALMQCLLNLFENTRKYAAEGKVLQLRLERVDGEAQLRIQDQGPGIEASQRETIFERFRRGVSQKDGSIPGVGLGLYLARRILQTHGGDLQAVDPPSGQGGACFLLRLPLAPTTPT